MKQIPLLRTVDLRPHGGQYLWFVRTEVEGDLRLVSIQSAGMEDSKLYQMGRFKEQNWVEEEDQNLLCITAMDVGGNIIWQRGTPWGLDRPWRTHGGMEQACFHDVDRDGYTEMIYIHKDQLVMLDAASGAQKSKIRLDADNYAAILPVNVEGHPHRRAFLLKVQDAAYEPYTYGNPVVFYSSDLKVLWPARSYVGAAYHPWALDSDGDGKEEILVGYNLVDHDGTTLWSLDIPDPSEHCDNRDVVDMDGDGVLEIAYAGSKDSIVCDMSGNIVRRIRGRHVQSVRFAKLDQDLPGVQLLCAEKWGGFTAYDLGGNALWTREKGSVAPVRWHPEDPVDLLIYRQPESPPVLVNGRLEPVMRFEAGEALLTVRKPPKDDPYAIADYGNILNYTRQDLDGDGVEEMVFYNRETMWVYGGPGTEVDV
jgi:hypothetical protein